MTRSSLTPGTVVATPRGEGAVIDVRATTSGKFVVGVELETGEVAYLTEVAARPVDASSHRPREWNTLSVGGFRQSPSHRDRVDEGVA